MAPRKVRDYTEKEVEKMDRDEIAEIVKERWGICYHRFTGVERMRAELLSLQEETARRAAEAKK